MGRMATTQEKLDEAIEARHQLVVGRGKSSITLGERRVEYTQANLAALDAYIAELRRELSGKPASARRNRIRYVAPL